MEQAGAKKDREAIIVKGVHYQTGEAVAVRMEQGYITGIDPSTDAGGVEEQQEQVWLAPGFVDLQINGAGGLDFNTLPQAPETALRVTEQLWDAGVTSYCPTVITNGSREIASAVAAISAAADRYPAVRQGLAGIHLEGPFISLEDGPRGAHPREHVRAPDWELFCRWQEAASGRIRIITVSPEWPEACAFIARCAENGVLVSIGHTAASPEQIREAVAAGARMSTHLGNGAHLTLPRHPNYIWEQLAEEELYTCVIADGFHLPLSVLRVIHKVKGDRLILVSDAVSFSGMPPGVYDHHIGGRVVLTPEGRLHMEANPGLLAGSVKLAPIQVAHLLRHGLVTLEEAWNSASVIPAGVLGLPQAAGLSVGAPADLVLFTRKGGDIHILETYKQGSLVMKARQGGE